MCSTYKFIFMQINTFCTKTRFETEANPNSGIGYSIGLPLPANSFFASQLKVSITT